MFDDFGGPYVILSTDSAVCICSFVELSRLHSLLSDMVTNISLLDELNEKKLKIINTNERRKQRKTYKMMQIFQFKK